MRVSKIFARLYLTDNNIHNKECSNFMHYIIKYTKWGGKRFVASDIITSMGN